MLQTILLSLYLTFHQKIERIYSTFQKKDTPRLLYIIVAYLTFLIPTLRALKGFLYVRDPAWFLHPIVCFSFVLSYSLHFIRKGVFTRFLTAKGVWSICILRTIYGVSSQPSDTKRHMKSGWQVAFQEKGTYLYRESRVRAKDGIEWNDLYLACITLIFCFIESLVARLIICCTIKLLFQSIASSPSPIFSSS